MPLLSLACGVAVGLALGLTGGGGSILAVPMLVYILNSPPREAVSISLVAVGATSLAGAAQRLFRGEVELKTGLLFAASGMVGAPIGTWVGGWVSEALLLILFAVLMILVATRMWRKASGSPKEAAVIRALSWPDWGQTGPACQRDSSGRLPLTSRCLALLLGAGIVTGALSGMFGVGGGFVIVPALVLLTGLDIHRAVATSLLVIALVSGAALASHLLAGQSVPSETAIPMAGGGVIGMGLGTWVGRRLSPVFLQKAFSVVIVAVAFFVIARGFA